MGSDYKVAYDRGFSKGFAEGTALKGMLVVALLSRLGTDRVDFTDEELVNLPTSEVAVLHDKPSNTTSVFIRAKGDE